MNEFEKAAIIVMVMLASIAVVCLVAVIIASKNIDKLETENSITKDKYFELDHKIFNLEKRIEKLEPKDEANTPAPDDHWMQAREYTLNAIKNYPITDEVLKRVLDGAKKPLIPEEHYKKEVSSRMDYTTWLTIKECIDLLSTDGKGTKQQVKEKLEELIKDE